MQNAAVIEDWVDKIGLTDADFQVHLQSARNLQTQRNLHLQSELCNLSEVWRLVMIRASHLLAAAVVGALGAGSLTLGAQAPANPPPKAPEMKSVLAGKKFTPPIRGEATVDIIKSPTKRDGTTLVTKIQVKNTSAGPIPRLTVDEAWVRQEKQPHSGRQGRDQRLLQPGEIQTMEVRTPVNPNMAHQHAAVQPRERHGQDAHHLVHGATRRKDVAKAPAKKKKR